METQSNTFKDNNFVIGLILIPISFGLHLFLNLRSANFSTHFSENEGAFYINYIIAAAYFIGTTFITMLKHWFKFSYYDYRSFICALILFSISCFTLNIPYAIFSKFGTWVNVYLILMHIALIALCFNNILPTIVKNINFFILGLGLVMAVYFTIYLFPFSIIAVFGAVFFGLTLHLLAPAIMVATIIVQFIKKGKTLTSKIAFYSGVIIPLLVILLYTVKWNETKELIHQTQATIITRPDNKLPQWILMSQELEDDYFTEQILKGDLVYETKLFNDFGFNFSSGNSLGEVKEHDPLVVIGSELMGEIKLSEAERIKILESKYDLRHLTKRKLWSGQHLTTSSVLTNIQVFPEYRLAYTEKIIRINNFNKKGWNREEEALYTFYLPEGSVATSLSLWINGKEEKSRLTTKSKADSAYVSIVGVEKRDPSVLHWQEGNTITVYVFPCMPEEERMFKIGVTTPLKNDGKQLVLQNVYFDGPDASSALETTVIEYKTDTDVSPILPASFKEILPNKFQYDGAYNPYWESSCNLIQVSKNAFNFNGNSYRIIESEPKLKNVNLNNFYLDINKSWTKNEFDDVWSLIKTKNVYVFYDKLYQINESNKDKYFELLHQLNFSLFPLNKISDVENALLISKSTVVAPILMDLKDTPFINDLKSYLEKRNERINLFNLSAEVSPYIKTLKEFQLFNYAKGETTYLKQFLDKGIYPNDNQDENTVNIEVSNVMIKRTDVESVSSAPDHLLRLFAYNKIMQECGRNYFTTGDFVENKLIDIANEAYIVSPISSLIVLETIKDYERFNIDENKNSLKNASTQSAGAVPEPHEWALIIILALTMLFLFYKRRININSL